MLPRVMGGTPRFGRGRLPSDARDGFGMGWLSRAPGRRGRIICCLLLRPVDHSSAWQRNLHPRSYVAPSAFTRSSVASTVAVFALTGYLRRVKVILPVTSVILNPTDSSIQEALVQFNALPVGQGHRLRHEYAVRVTLGLAGRDARSPPRSLVPSLPPTAFGLATLSLAQLLSAGHHLDPRVPVRGRREGREGAHARPRRPRCASSRSDDRRPLHRRGAALRLLYSDASGVRAHVAQRVCAANRMHAKPHIAPMWRGWRRRA
ncbi:hypothetical protein BD311DRAFT_251865 [Dichomitus squalens]|uniref:Uncharacterized protein n=1 Tax=Dichomitus squalens TaxID=114155 RepID=A0A4Q9MQG9_9APHY|nr:hypothetical protein BD311DRAFT_251865 [Dichomitus squalens]